MSIALSLLDDPSFPGLSDAEKRQEVSDLLTSAGEDGSDPLAVAVVLEEWQEAVKAAEAPQAPRQDATGATIERHDPGCSGAVVSAIGRCMGCGAYVGAPVAMFEAVPMTEVSISKLELLEAEQESREALQAVRQAVERLDPVLYRIKTATGLSDRAMAETIGISRSTFQAYIGGRLPERLDRKQIDALANQMKGQVARLRELIDEVEGCV
jgi:hypothetical protein